MATLTAAVITQNDAKILPWALHNLLIECDQVIVVDGISHDNTEEIVLQKARELNAEHKLRYHKKKFERLNIQRNYYLNLIETDFVMYCDSDEIFTIDHLRKIRNYMELYDCILIRSHHFFIDFWHIACGGGWENSWMMPRCFRNIPGRLHYQDYEPKLGDHTLFINKSYFRDFWKNKTIICDKEDVVCYHMGHALGIDHQKRKIRFFLEQDSPELPKDQYDKIIISNGYFDMRFWAQGINADPNGIKPFTGKHPDILKTHPLYNVRVIKHESGKSE
jgi:glycosyltransferase involved in cell wall biosynthesis